MVISGNQTHFVKMSVLEPNLPHAKFYQTFGNLQRSLNFVTKIAQYMSSSMALSAIKCMKMMVIFSNQA